MSPVENLNVDVDMSKSKWKTVLRWILFIPVAFVVKTIAYALVWWMYRSTANHALGYLSLTNDAWSWDYLIGTIFVTAMSTYVAIVAAIKTAPSHKKAAALTMMIIFVLLSGMALTTTVLSEISGWRLAYSIIEIVVSFATCIYAYLATTDEGLEFS